VQYGIWYFWKDNNLIDPQQCVYAVDSNATWEYQDLSGCTTSIPLDQGNSCGNWNGVCFKDELMSYSGGSKISRITIAALEDIGYTVDYSQADAYTANDMDPSCLCNGTDNEDGPKRQ